MVHSLSSSLAYPEMLVRAVKDVTELCKSSSTNRATVEVKLQRTNRRGKLQEFIIDGKIAALIYKKGVINQFRVGSLLFTGTQVMNSDQQQKDLQLARDYVMVPHGWTLDIEVDLQIGPPNNPPAKGRAHGKRAVFRSELKKTFSAGIDNQPEQVGDVQVTVHINLAAASLRDFIAAQLSPPVQVTKEPYGRGQPQEDRITVEYTIGDNAMSFVEFIMVLRRILANGSNDILDGHDLLNLSSTREHPVLPKREAGVPKKWIHVKLQVKDKDNEDTVMQEEDYDNEDTKTWITLIMRDDDLYVLGFENHKGVYGLVDDLENDGMLPPDVYKPEKLKWTVQYKSILGDVSDAVALEKLMRAHLGYEFAIDSVRALSAFTKHGVLSDPAKVEKARVALAGLIVLVCESARLNPILDAFAAGWSTGTGFTARLMNDYSWKGRYAAMSRDLLEWRSRNYCASNIAPHPIEKLQAVYLVRKTPTVEDASEKKVTQDKENMLIDGSIDRNKVLLHGSSSQNIKGPPTHGSKGEGEEAKDGGGEGTEPKDGTTKEVGANTNDGVKGKRKNSSSGPPQKRTNTGRGGGSDNQTSDDDEDDDDDDDDDPSSPDNSGGGSASRYQRRWNNTDDTQLGRPMVALLAMHAKLGPESMRIIVMDSKRRQIIYRREEQRQQETPEEQGQEGTAGMEELVLTGPYARISAYGPFAIEIQRPEGVITGTWEWDCYDKYAAQVDQDPVIETIGDNVAKVTYAVMSNAREATVKVKLPADTATISGKITARIGDFPQEVILFDSKSEGGTGTTQGSWFFPKLARSVVAVPCGAVLKVCIQLALQFSTSMDNNVTVDEPIEFHNIENSDTKWEDKHKQVEVGVTWYPEGNEGITGPSVTETNLLHQISGVTKTLAAGPSQQAKQTQTSVEACTAEHVTTSSSIEPTSHMTEELTGSYIQSMDNKLQHSREMPKDLTFHLLEQITNSFSKEHKVGSGRFGEVYKGVLPSGEEIAVKKLYHIPGLDDVQFKKEFNSLMRVQHNNIIRLVAYCYEVKHKHIKINGEYVFAKMEERALCFEFLQHGSLHNYLSDESCGFDWRTRYNIIKGTCEGLNYLHNGSNDHIYHWDLKPSNILLDGNFMPKIADFGLSRLFGSTQTYTTKSFIGTQGYMPPEYIDKRQISKKFDIFSLGVIIIQIMTGPLGFSKCGEMSPQEFTELVQKNWSKRLQATSSHASQESNILEVRTCIEIALRCVETNRHKRPTIREIIDELNEIENLKRSLIRQCLQNPENQLDRVVIDPMEVRFLFEVNKDVSCVLKLTNRSAQFVAFRMNANRSKYHIQPHRGVIPPWSNCYVIVTLRALGSAPPNMQCNDMLLLQSSRMTLDMGSSAVDDLTEEEMETTMDELADEVVLPIVYITIPSPPNPLH